MGADLLAILIIVAVLAGGTKSGRAFLREAWKAGGWRSPRAAMQHHSGRAGALTGRALASAARVPARPGSRPGRSTATAGIGRTRRGPLIPLMWRPAADDAKSSADDTPAAAPDEDYGPGPWVLHARSRSGRKINQINGTSSGAATVWDPADLRRRLDAAAGDPDIEVRVTPLPPTEGPNCVRALRVCAACGNFEGGERGPLVTYDEPVFGDWPGGPRLIHKAHFEDESTGFYGKPYKPAPDPDDPGGGSPQPGNTHTTGGNNMSTRYHTVGPGGDGSPGRSPDGPPLPFLGPDRDPGPGRRPPGVAQARADVGAAWKGLASATADFEPEDDAHLLTWMAGETAGMTVYAESITDVYETCVNSVGVDPVAMQALHEYAETAAEAAQAMATARQKFASHYAEVREFAAAGGKLPYNGRWLTGEGDT